MDPLCDAKIGPAPFVLTWASEQSEPESASKTQEAQPSSGAKKKIGDSDYKAYYGAKVQEALRLLIEKSSAGRSRTLTPAAIVRRIQLMHILSAPWFAPVCSAASAALLSVPEEECGGSTSYPGPHYGTYISEKRLLNELSHTERNAVNDAMTTYLITEGDLESALYFSLRENGYTIHALNDVHLRYISW